MTHEVKWSSATILGHTMLAQNVAAFSGLDIVEKDIACPMTLVAKGLMRFAGG